MTQTCPSATQVQLLLDTDKYGDNTRFLWVVAGDLAQASTVVAKKTLPIADHMTK